MLAEELFEDVIKPNIYPRAQGSDRREPARRRAPGAGLGRARLHDEAARALPRRRRSDREPARVRRSLRDRQAQEAVRRRRDEGRHHARVREASTASISPSRGRTPIASATTRCSPWSAIRPRATPTSGCARWRAATTGRCSISTKNPRARWRAGRRASLGGSCAPGSTGEGLTCAPSAPRLRSHAREHIVTIDTDSAPRIMFYGENLMIEDLPVGTRVIYPKRPMTPVANPTAAIRYALNHPEDSEPLHALLSPGHEGHDRGRRHLDAAADHAHAGRARSSCSRSCARCSPITASTTSTSSSRSACIAGCTTGRSSGWSARRCGTSTGRIGCTTTTAAIPTAWSCSARRRTASSSR